MDLTAVELGELMVQLNYADSKQKNANTTRLPGYERNEVSALRKKHQEYFHSLEGMIVYHRVTPPQH